MCCCNFFTLFIANSLYKDLAIKNCGNIEESMLVGAAIAKKAKKAKKGKVTQLQLSTRLVEIKKIIYKKELKNK